MPTYASTGRLAAALFLAVALSGCAPVFSDLQSAKLVPPGQVELTPAVGTVTFSDPRRRFGRVQASSACAAFVLHDASICAALRAVQVAGERADRAGVARPTVRLVQAWLSLYVPLGRASAAGTRGLLRPWRCSDSAAPPAAPTRWRERGREVPRPLNDDCAENLLFQRMVCWSAGPSVGCARRRRPAKPDDRALFNLSLGLSLRP